MSASGFFRLADQATAVVITSMVWSSGTVTTLAGDRRSSMAVLIGLIGPILTILFSWWLLDEPLSVEQLLGTGLVVCGLLVVIRR